VLCLVTALAVAGHLAWQLWGTGLATARAQRELRTDFTTQIEHPRWEGAAPPPDTKVAVPGQGVAILRIPRLNLDMVVVEGTGTEELKKGPGHYENTAYPWDPTGRVGIAGHRTTYGHPFWGLDKLREGDRIELATEFGTFDYRVTRFLVIPADEAGWVLDATRRATLVLTTCTPRFLATHRLVVFADRVGLA
jgi:sortase A